MKIFSVKEEIRQFQRYDYLETGHAKKIIENKKIKLYCIFSFPIIERIIDSEIVPNSIPYDWKSKFDFYFIEA